MWAEIVKCTIEDAKAQAERLAMEPKVHSTIASAARGAITLAAAGGVTGFTTGSAIGAITGILPALFTFGLSIPVGALVGGGIGTFVGTTIGGGTGLVAGGLMGYKQSRMKEAVNTVPLLASVVNMEFASKSKSMSDLEPVIESSELEMESGIVMSALSGTASLATGLVQGLTSGVVSAFY